MPSFPIVGAHFRPPAKILLAALPLGQKLVLIPEPENPYDENAIAVHVRSEDIAETLHDDLREALPPAGFDLEDVLAEPSTHLGYIPAVEAKNIKLEGPTDGRLASTITGKPAVSWS